MTYAYDENMIDCAQNLLASMLDFSIYGLGYDLADCYSKFLASKYPGRIERGNSAVITGMSGIELAYEVLGDRELSKSKMSEYEQLSMNRSPEFWTGWIIAFFQWESQLSFNEINKVRNISDIRKMYSPYHEMDVLKFCDAMRELYKNKFTSSRLKSVRSLVGMSQRELSEISGIPIKTIQQYEQRQKNINHARVDYLISLSKALSCDIDMLIEKIN